MLVCGDSGNDIDMFSCAGVKACCVANAQEDLVAFLRGQRPDENTSANTQLTLHLAEARKLIPTEDVSARFFCDSCVTT